MPSSAVASQETAIQTPEVQEQPAAAAPPRRAFLRTHAKSLVVAAVVALLAFGYFHQLQATNALKHQNQKLANPTATAQAQAVSLRDQVAKLVELPSDEVPTIATVSDVTKLQSQAFFKNARNGDKVLMFAKAREAVLYRPSDNKIIQMAPLGSDASAQH